MKIDIKEIVRAAKVGFPDLIGGIHFINAGRQIEYKLEKPKESFNYRVRVTILHHRSQQEILNELFKLIKKGMKAYKSHVTVVRFRTLYAYECIMMPSQVTYESTHYSYTSGFRDFLDDKRYRLFSIKKYGPELAYKLAKLNTFLAKNPVYIPKFKIKHSQYIDQKEHSLNIRISFPEISFLYISYITTNVESMDYRIHFILADLVCDFVLKKMKKMQTVENLPTGIYCNKYKNSVVFETKVWNEKTGKWTNRYRSTMNNPDAYREILKFLKERKESKPRISKTMKMKSEHYVLLKACIREFLKNEGKNINELRSEFVKAHKPEGMLRWKIFKSALIILEKQKIDPEEFFDYLLDTHIEVALKNILKELELEA